MDESIAFLGSSNFDIRSFSLNFEVNLLLYGQDATQSLRERQMEYLHNSHAIDLTEWREQGSFKRISQDIAKLFSPLL